MLLNLSDRQFDPVAKDMLRKLLNEAESDADMRDGLKKVLDVCVHGSLCSDFEIRVLDLAWRSYGGSP